MIDDNTILDCGHTPSPHASITTGYGTFEGKTYCYDCSANIEREAMLATGQAGLYWDARKPETIRDWPGHLRFTVLGWKHSQMFVPGAWSQVDRYDLWFVGPDNHIWHGIQRGDMEFTRCKRTKRTWPYPATV